MAIQMGKAMAFTALGGLVAGLVGCAGEQTKTDSPAGAGTTDPSATPADAKECCKGKNPCSGKGRCAVPGQNECAGKNPCGGKGGCNKGCPGAAPAGTAAPAAQ